MVPLEEDITECNHDGSAPEIWYMQLDSTDYTMIMVQTFGPTTVEKP